MAAGETDVADLAVAVRDVYRQAEEALLEVVAEQVARDVAHDITPGNDPSTAGTASTATRTAADEAVAVGRIAEVAARIVRRLDAALEGTVGDVLTEAQRRGYDEAGREVRSLLSRARHRDRGTTANLGALASFARALVDTIRGAHRSILRQTRDAYRTVVADTFAPKAAGASPRRRDHAQRALDELADRGVVGFTDRAGRDWRLSTYVEMATRSASARTMVDAQLERLESLGHDLVYVGNSPQECVLCRPWEGKILRVKPGPIGRVSVLSEVSDDHVVIDIAGTVEGAYLAGFGHPNCRHALSAYLAGATRIPEATADPEGDANRQRHRYLERQVRKWRERSKVALDDTARRRADTKVAHYRGLIDEHVKATGLIRQPNRERIDLGHRTSGTPATGGRRSDVRTAIGDDGSDVAAARAAADKAARAADDEAQRRAADPQHHGGEPDLVDEVPEPSPGIAAPAEGDEPGPVDVGGPPDELTDDELEQAVAATLAVGDDDAMARFEVLAAEQEAREERAQRADAKRARDRDRYARRKAERDAARSAADEAAWARAEQLIDAGWDPLEATAEATGRTVAAVQLEEATRRLRAEGYRGTWAVMSRESFKDFLEEEIVRAEDATRGAMLNKRADRAGVHPIELWWGNDTTARARASEEMLAWFDEHGRVTLDEWRDRLITGRAGPGAREDYRQ